MGSLQSVDQKLHQSLFSFITYTQSVIFDYGFFNVITNLCLEIVFLDVTQRLVEIVGGLDCMFAAF